MQTRPVIHVSALTLALGAAGLSLACDNKFDDKPKAEVAEPAKQAVEAKATVEPAAPAAPVAVEVLKLDAEKSSIGFVGAKVTGKHDGSFKTISGSGKLAGTEVSELSFEVETASVESDAEKLTGHLKSADFFDVEKYPKASFRSTRIEAAQDGENTHRITGDLTLLSVTKSITFPAKVEVTGKTAKGSAEFTINRKDFGIQYAGMKDDLIKDEVLLKIDLTLTGS